jgi:transposase-like protein
MLKQRKRYTAEFKARAALEVVKAHRSLNELASEYEVHPNQLMQWKRQLLESLPLLFADKRSQGEKDQGAREAELYQQIGQLKVELDWMKKKAGLLGR